MWSELATRIWMVESTDPSTDTCGSNKNWKYGCVVNIDKAVGSGRNVDGIAEICGTETTANLDMRLCVKFYTPFE